MDALQQHLFDSYRAAQRGEPAPPAPGTHDVAVVRGLRDRRRFERVVAGRPATGRLRESLARAVARLSGRRAPGSPVRPS
ncbi:hypothetical protein [Streptomyces omiyaensis]|uniref:Uncharacterized protein n=1 Tax=Streptomyces omiyaensis TaxID=68247 RepID=A0ABW7BVC0_9ACTN|nr:hypothetical protein [Streptomyces omiyaensis]GGY44369.1 hypothetical protein GCM10010363_26620 [Streptomyces omiyaensis]